MSLNTQSILKKLAIEIANGKGPKTIVLGGANEKSRHKNALIIDNCDTFHKYEDGCYFIKEDFTDKSFVKQMINIVGKVKFKKILADWSVIKNSVLIDTELCQLYGDLLETGGTLCFPSILSVCLITIWEDKEGQKDGKRWVWYDDKGYPQVGAKQILEDIMEEGIFISTGIKIIMHLDKNIIERKLYGSYCIILYNIDLLEYAGFNVKHIMNSIDKKNKIPYPLDDPHPSMNNDNTDYYLATKKY